MSARESIIPVFVPHWGCPNDWPRPRQLQTR